jgi:hypothetical protein
MRIAMPIGRSLLVLALFAAATPAADQPTLRTLDGKATPCEVVSLNTTQVVVKVDGVEKTVPVDQVLQLDFPSPVRLRDTKYIDVELNDGSLLHCAHVALRGKAAEVDLVTGQKLTIPLDAITYVLNEAHDPKSQRQWKEILAKKRNSDVLGVLRDGELVPFNGTFGDADADGTHIQFDLNSRGMPQALNLEKAQGIAFLRMPDPKAPPAVCKLSDTMTNLLMVSALSAGADTYTVTTPAGVKVEYPKALLVRLDYSKGKLTYLSDLDPAKVVYSSTEETPQPYRRDKNLDNQPLTLRSTGTTQLPWGKGSCPKGLALHAYTALEYDLGSDYREFSAWVGVDPTVGGSDGGTKVLVQGDGKELYSGTIMPRDEPVHVTCNVKDVRRLRIVVSSADLLDLGRHVDLADAKVSK